MDKLEINAQNLADQPIEAIRILGNRYHDLAEQIAHGDDSHDTAQAYTAISYLYSASTGRYVDRSQPK